jgi:hypothetical protein
VIRKPFLNDLLTSSNQASAATHSHDYHNHVLSRLQLLQNQWREASHQQCMLDPEVANSIRSEYDRLETNIERLLKVRLGRNPQGGRNIIRKTHC